MISFISRLKHLIQWLAIFSDVSSRLRYLGMRTHRRPPRGIHLPALPMRVRSLNNQCVYCRPGTTDLSVLYATFCGQYHLPPADLKISSIIDLGSNIGLTMAHYAQLYPEAHVLGIEMDPENANLCRSNIAPYAGRCEVLTGAIWKEDGEICYGGEQEYGFRIIPNSHVGKRKARAFSMQSLIDSLGIDTVDFVKMDIEGAEEALLADPSRWIVRVRCLKVEVHAPYSVRACVEDLRRVGMLCEVQLNHPACVLARQP